MQKKILPEAEKYTKRNKLRRIWHKIVQVMACIVVFCTTYALILPAITLEKPTVCGIEVHTHTVECYREAAQTQQTQIVCTALNHSHTEQCQDANGSLICMWDAEFLHLHNDSCRNEAGELICPMEEREAHTHNDNCYAPAEPHVHEDSCYTVTPGELTCTLEETEGHTHGDGCSQSSLTCTAHIHSAECWQQDLTCTEEAAEASSYEEAVSETVLTCESVEEGHVHDETACYETVTTTQTVEVAGHTHGDGCYQNTLICGQPEEAHTHAEGCYETTVVCTLEETEGHTHGEACYAQNREMTCGKDEQTEEGALELVCSEEEYIPHIHEGDCFTEHTTADGATYTVLTCTRPQVWEHYHGEECIVTAAVSADPEELTCTLEESEGHTHGETCQDETGALVCKQEENAGHTHGELCYGQWELICELAEHTHADECYAELTEEELAQVEYVIGLIDEMPSADEIDAKVAEFEEAGDDEGEEAYLTEVYQQVSEVYQMYSDLGEELQPFVTNADKLMELEYIWSAETLEEPAVTVDENGNSVITISNVNYYTPGEVVLIDGYMVSEFNNKDYTILFQDIGNLTDEAKASFVDNQPTFIGYTAFIIEFLNNGRGQGIEYYVDAVVSCDASTIMNPGVTMTNLTPKTDSGFIIYVPNSMLNVSDMPSRGDLVSSDFWYGDANVIIGRNTDAGNMHFSDNPASTAVLETAGPTTVNATVKMFDYGSNMNSLHPDEYLFWNGDYGYGADIESVDGWGADFILVNGEYVGAWPFEGGNISLDAYHGYNRFPTMVPTLSTDGYPQFSDKTPSNIGQPVELDYLFDGTYQTGSTMSGGGGLFQQDSDGYYYYDSLQNAAYFNGSSFVLYDDLIVRPWADSNDSSAQAYGNFLPLNPITTGNITLDGYVYSEDRSTLSKTTGWTGALTVEGQSEASATKTLEQDGNNRLKQSVYDLGLYTARLEEKTNLWFGMTVDFEFYQPANGQVDNVLTEAVDLKDMIFDFHGDDDVLVYVGVWNDETKAYDYKLTLDLSGVHEARSGNINFATGAVYYQKHNHDTRTSTESIPGTGRVDVKTTLGQIFGLEGNTFTDYTKLAIKFFYLERGGNISYCRLRFNMPTLPEKSLMVTKELQYDSGDEELKDYIADAYDYQFRVMKANASGGATSTVLIPEGATYSILENGAVVGTGTVGEDGIFTLKAGQSALFEDLLETYGNVNYVVQELITTEIEGQYENVWYSVNGGTNTETNKDTSTSHDFTSFDTGKLSTSQSENVVYRNKVDVEKLSSLRITKAAAEGATFAEGTKFQIQVTLGGEPLPVGATYKVGTETRTVNTEGIIELAVGETALIDGILSGTEYTVREMEGSYTTTYTGQTSGTLGIGEVIEITVTNADYATHVTLPVQKTYLGNSGKATFHFGVEQVDADGNVIAQLEGTSITVTGADAASGNIHIKYSSGVVDGTYYYRVYEKSGSLNAIYDTTVYLVTVEISRNSENKPVASVTQITKNGEIYSDTNLAFVNQKLTNVAITKTVTGNVSPQGLKFSFTATVLYNGAVYAPVENSAYTVNEDGTVSFELEAGETISIRGIPVGAQITVTETVREGFEPSYTVGGTVTEGNTVTYTVAESANSIVCNNEGTYLLPQTGGAGTTTYTMAGMMLMLFSAAYLLYRFSKRRREAC